MESLIEYILHYLKMPDALIFLVLAIILGFIFYILLTAYARLTAGRHLYGEERRFAIYEETDSLTERFFELIFSGTSILLFMAIYYLTERFAGTNAYGDIWNKYHDFILLLMIIFSCLFNSLLDHVFVKLHHLTPDDKASIRLLGMLYMILIFAYIKFIYKDDNYDMFITYFLGLMVGRFVYFDASLKDFIHNIKDAAENIPLMCIVLLYMGILCLYGFKTKYLYTHYGVINNVFFAHLFMCITVFLIFYLSHAVQLVTRRKRN